MNAPSVTEMEERRKMDNLIDAIRKRNHSPHDTMESRDNSHLRSLSRRKRPHLMDDESAAQCDESAAQCDEAAAQCDEAAAYREAQELNRLERINDPAPMSSEFDPMADPVWLTSGLPTRVALAREFGSPGPQEMCFGCANNIGDDERRTAGIFHEELQEMFDLPRLYIGQAHPRAIVKAMAKRYTRVRAKVNARAADHEELLPVWTEADILECMYHHNCDPEWQTFLRLMEMQEMFRINTERNIVETRGVGSDQQMRLHKDHLNGYCRLLDSYYKVSARDHKKLMFYSDGSRLDQRALKKGIIGAAGKNIRHFYSRVQREPGGNMGFM